MSWVSLKPLHERTAFRPSVTQQGAEGWGVPLSRFTDWRWQMRHQIMEQTDTCGSFELTDEERKALDSLRSVFHAGVTPYYASLVDPARQDCPIRLQAMPRLAELDDPAGLDDPLAETNHSPVPELVHVYPDRVAFCAAQLCPVYCRYCFRKRRDQQTGLHFNPRIIQSGLDYIARTPTIRDVLITGGDPLVAHDTQILSLVASLRAIPHVAIIRIGTRVPVTLPYRITPELAAGLAEHHPVWINTHFNCAEELTPEAAAAVDTLLAQGIPVGNQTVLLAGVNDSVDAMKALLEGLIRMRVRPYYLYHPQMVSGTAHLRVPIEKGLDIMRGLRGQTTGFGIPTYVLDTPYGKQPISPQHIVGRDGDDIVLATHKAAGGGGVWKEPSPLNGYVPEVPLPEVAVPV
jgi:lysine 2,3-aminomutase